ncbi:MAG: phage tail tape measure protein [Leucobacter sp.]
MAKVGVDVSARIDKRTLQKSADDAARDLTKSLGQAGTKSGGEFADNFETRIRQINSEQAAKITEARFGDAGKRSGKNFTGSAEKAIKQGNWHHVARSAARDFDKSFERASRPKTGKVDSSGMKRAGDDSGNTFVAAFGSKMKAGIASVVAAGVAALGKGIRDAAQMEVDLNLAVAKTGLDESTIQRAGKAAGDAYRRGFGESMGANANAAALAVQQGLLAPDASQSDMAELIRQLNTVATIMGEDITAVARAAGKAIQTGVADDAAHAFDQFTIAQQKGLNIAGDYLDTITEYSTQFRKLGIDGELAMGLISQAMRNGARDSDKVADSLKELSIRAVDGSDSTAQAFEALGLNADEMALRFAQGGANAAQGLDIVLQQLRRIDSPAEQARVAVMLFGTQAEDMGAALSSMDVSTAVQGLGDVEDAADKAGRKMKEGLQADTEAAVRSIEVELAKLGNSFLNVLAPAADRGLKVINDGLQTALNSARDLVNLDFGSLWDNLRKPIGGGFVPKSEPEPPQLGDNPQLEQLLLPGYVPTPDRGPNGEAPGAPGAPPLAPPPGLPPEEESSGSGRSGSSQGPVVPWNQGDPASLLQGQGLPLTSSLLGSAKSVLEARHRVEQESAELQAAMADAEATEADIQKARNELLDAEQDLQQRELSLYEAKIKATEQQAEGVDKASKSVKSSIDGLDADFGISKGIGGVVENLIRAAFMPLMMGLDQIKQATNPNEGSGLVGMLAARGVFGPRFLPKVEESEQSDYAPTGQRGPSSGSSAYPGDAALLSHVPAGRYSQSGSADLTQGLADCSSAVEDLVNLMDGQPTAGRSMSTGNAAEWLTSRGFLPGSGGPGDMRVAFNSGHMQATLPGGTPFNWGSDSAAARGGVGGSGADDPALTSRYYRPVSGSVGGPVTASPVPAPSLGAGPSGGPVAVAVTNWPATGGAPPGVPAGPVTPGAPSPAGPATPGGPLTQAEIYGPQNTNPALTPPVGAGSGGLPGVGPVPQAGPGVPQFGTPGPQPILGGPPQYAAPQQGGGWQPQGGGLEVGGGLIGAAAGAASMGADMFAPGSGAAVQMGMELAKRSVSYAAEMGSHAVNGILETVLPNGGMGFDDTIPGRMLGGFAGMTANVGNAAGETETPLQPEQGGGNNGQDGQGGQPAQGGPMVYIDTYNRQPEQSDVSSAKAIARRFNAGQSGMPR